MPYVRPSSIVSSLGGNLQIWASNLYKSSQKENLNLRRTKYLRRELTNFFDLKNFIEWNGRKEWLPLKGMASTRGNVFH